MPSKRSTNAPLGRLRELQVDDVKSAKTAADLELKIRVAEKQLVKLRKSITAQRDKVDATLRKARHAHALEARELWQQQFVPELIGILDRLIELREIYRKLKSNGVLNPKFPPGIERALGKNDLWLKRRKAEWFPDEANDRRSIACLRR